MRPVTCSLLWVRCLFDRLSISDFGGKWPLKWKFSKMSFRIPRQDTEIRSVTKFGENQPLRSCRKVVCITTQKNSRSAGLVPAPILPKMGQSRPKFPERCHALTYPRIPNLVRIGCALPDLFRKDWFFGQKSQYNIGFQPTSLIKCSAHCFKKLDLCYIFNNFNNCGLVSLICGTLERIAV